MSLFSSSGSPTAANRKSGGSRRDPRRRQRRPRFVPRLEPLEGRLAPAVLTVNTLADETTADNFLSLREAITVVDNPGTYGSLSTAEQAQISGTLRQNDTIQFAHGLTGTITLGSSGHLLRRRHFQPRPRDAHRY
jgi:CSLREA domain-containing protein